MTDSFKDKDKADERANLPEIKSEDDGNSIQNQIYLCTEWVVTSMVEIQLHAVKTSDKAPFKMMLKRLHGNFFKAALNLESTRAGLCRNVSELGTSG